VGMMIEVEAKGRSAVILSLAVPMGVAAVAVALIAFPAYASAGGVPTPDELATWPAQVLLAAVALASLWVAYKTWQHSLACQEKASAALAQIAQSITEQVEEAKRTNNLLADRPCIARNDRS
jgi:hypothetical protein